MQTKTIYHYVGASRNYGDMAIQHSMMDMLTQSASSGPSLNFIPIDLKLPGDLNEATVELINDTGDMLLVGGGGLIMPGDGFPTESNWQFNISLDNLYRLQVPLVIYAIGYNQFPYGKCPETEKMWNHLRCTGEKAELFSVRDYGTEKILRSNGVKDIFVTPDPALFTKSNDNAFNALKAMYGFEADDLLIGINLAGDRHLLRHGDTKRNDIIRNFAQVLKKLGYQYSNIKYVYIPHVDIYDHIGKMVLREILREQFYDASVLAWMFPERLCHVPSLAGIYKNMNLTIGMRGHSNILSFGQNTPYIAFGKHDKNKFFVEMTDGVIVNDSCDALYEQAQHLLFNPPREQMKLKLEVLRKMSDLYHRSIIALLRGY